MTSNLLHATAVAIDNNGILLFGPSGSGKSDLALRLIDRGAILISDDAVILNSDGAQPLLETAPNIAGQLEVRGIGILDFPSSSPAPLRMAVELVGEVERMPAGNETKPIGIFDVPLLMLAPFEPSAAIKLEQALRSFVDADRWPVARHSPDDAEEFAF